MNAGSGKHKGIHETWNMSPPHVPIGELADAEVSQG
jgi:hypothetical protein